MSLDSPIFDFSPRFMYLELHAESVHVVAYVFDPNDEEAAIRVVVKHFARLRYPLISLVLHRDCAREWCYLVQSSGKDLLFDRFALSVEIIEDVKRYHVLDSLLPIITNLPLQLENRLKIDFKLYRDVFETLTVVHVEHYPLVHQIFGVFLDVSEDLGVRVVIDTDVLFSHLLAVFKERFNGRLADLVGTSEANRG